MHVTLNTTMNNETWGLCGQAGATNDNYKNNVITHQVSEMNTCYELQDGETFEELNDQPSDYVPSDECDDLELLEAAKEACKAAGVFVVQCVEDVCATGNLSIVTALIEANDQRDEIEESYATTIAPVPTPTQSPTIYIAPDFPEDPVIVPSNPSLTDIAVCSSVGDPHFVTFSNHAYNFYGLGL